MVGSGLWTVVLRGLGASLHRSPRPGGWRQKQRPWGINPGPFTRLLPGDDLLSHTPTRAVPSALRGLTAVFGMGTGVSPSPQSPENLSLKRTKSLSTGSGQSDRIHWRRSGIIGQAERPISTGKLSASQRVHILPINLVIFQGSSGRPNLGGGFPLRCFQRLSFPNVATQPCRWRDNWCTRGSSIPVLSY